MFEMNTKYVLGSAHISWERLGYLVVWTDEPEIFTQEYTTLNCEYFCDKITVCTSSRH